MQWNLSFSRKKFSSKIDKKRFSLIKFGKGRDFLELFSKGRFQFLPKKLQALKEKEGTVFSAFLARKFFSALRMPKFSFLL